MKTLQSLDRPTNYYHLKLEALGQKIIQDEIMGFCHIYHFDCGCLRAYCVSPITMTDNEHFQPCKKHKFLVEKNGN